MENDLDLQQTQINNIAEEVEFHDSQITSLNDDVSSQDNRLDSVEDDVHEWDYKITALKVANVDITERLITVEEILLGTLRICTQIIEIFILSIRHWTSCTFYF